VKATTVKQLGEWLKTGRKMTWTSVHDPILPDDAILCYVIGWDEPSIIVIDIAIEEASLIYAGLPIELHSNDIHDVFLCICADEINMTAGTAAPRP
jgi:hypothetical protein